MDIEIRKVEKEELLGDLFDEFYDFWSARWLESLPDEPLTSKELLKMDIDDDEFDFVNRFFAFSQNKIVGDASISGKKPESPEYELNKEIGWMDIFVIPKIRGKGIGTRLALEALESVSNSCLKKVGAFTFLECGQKFLERIGGLLVSKYSQRNLDFSKLDWNLVKKWLEISKNLDPRWRIELRTEITDVLIEEIINLDMEITNELRTMSNAEFRSTRESAISQWNRVSKWIEKTGDTYICFVIKDEMDNAVGYTEGRIDKQHPDRYYQFITGVTKNKRGSGLGKLLKAFMLEHLHNCFPHVKTVSTGSNDLNAPMHGINNILGFTPGITRSSYRINVDEALEKLAK